MPFLGKQPTAGFSTIAKDDLTPDGSTTTFTLSKSVASANDIAVFVGNVRQEPTDAYSVSGTTLTMSAAPASGLNFYVLHIAGTTESSVIPADNTITDAKMASTLDLSGKTVTYGLTDSDMPAGSVLQVVSANFTSVVSATMTSAEIEDFSGISLSITPSSTSSKILLIASITYSVDDTGYPALAEISFRRSSTDLGIYTCSFGNVPDTTSAAGNLSMTELDSPNTTSAVTYQLQGKQRITSGADRTIYINATRNGSARGESRITLLEIAG